MNRMEVVLMNTMSYVAPLASLAFVFALSALAQVGSLKKEIKHLKAEIEKINMTIRLDQNK